MPRLNKIDLLAHLLAEQRASTQNNTVAQQGFDCALAVVETWLIKTNPHFDCQRFAKAVGTQRHLPREALDAPVRLNLVRDMPKRGALAAKLDAMHAR